MSVEFSVSVKLPAKQSTNRLSRDVAALVAELQPAADIVALIVSAYLAIWAYATVSNLSVSQLWNGHRGEAVIVSVLAPFFLYDHRLRRASGAACVRKVVWRTCHRYFKLALVAIVLAFATRTIDHLPRGLAGLWLCAGLALVICCKMALVWQLRLLERRGVLKEAVAVVGAGTMADHLVEHLRRCNPDDVEVVGIFDDRASVVRQAHGINHPVGTVSDLVRMGQTRQIDWVVLAMPSAAEMRLNAVVHSLKALAVSVGLCPESVGSGLPYQAIDYIGGGLPVTTLAKRPIRQWDALVKSMEDLILGSLVTALLLPLMAVIALAIRIDSPGPILYRQRRHTTNNCEFDVLKFRTMRWNPTADCSVLKQTSVNDDRVTRVGRFLRKSSLDELPQLFNVLKGEMSLVGPRPHAVNMRTEERLGHEIIDCYSHRHRVKPGMTGWAQVNGWRGATETAEQLRRRVEFDIYYIENWSLPLDLKILAMTVRVVLRGTNAW